jgi:hypothetical protein
MTDAERVQKIFKKIRVRITRYDKPEFIIEEAKENKAAYCLTALEMDFNFTKAGKLIGINSSSINSWCGLRKPKRAASRGRVDGKKSYRVSTKLR